jgi:hypothetical protein
VVTAINLTLQKEKASNAGLFYYLFFWNNQRTKQLTLKNSD